MEPITIAAGAAAVAVVAGITKRLRKGRRNGFDDISRKAREEMDRATDNYLKAVRAEAERRK